MGLVRLEPDTEGRLGRVTTSTAEAFRVLASDR